MAVILFLETSQRGAAREQIYATYVNGSGSTTLLFRYVSRDGDYTADLDYRDPSSLVVDPQLQLRRDRAPGTDSGPTDTLPSTAANLTLPRNGGYGSLGYNADIAIDTVAPSVVGVTSPNVPMSSAATVYTWHYPGAGAEGGGLDVGGGESGEGQTRSLRRATHTIVRPLNTFP